MACEIISQIEMAGNAYPMLIYSGFFLTVLY